MIEIKNITKSYDERKILDDISINFEEGKIYGIIGQNGSGKSVLLKVMSGFITPDQGSIIYDGKDINKEETFPDNTGVLLDNSGFIPNLTGFDNLKLLANINKTIDDNEIIDELKNVNLLEEKDKKYYKYSLGMRKKLGICQAVMEHQKYIILDEPFSGIDKKSLSMIYDYLKKIKNEGRTLIISTHTSDRAKDLYDEIYELEEGKLNKIEED